MICQPSGDLNVSTTVVVGLDPLHEDLAPLHLAATLARAVGAQLVAVSNYLHDPFTDAITGGSTERDRKSATTRALKHQAADHGAELLVAGDSSPAHTLHRVAEERHAVAIVVGSTRKGTVGRLTSGSTAERLLQGAPSPVVIVPRGAESAFERLTERAATVTR
jgi:nucleotide-binding universal stress UspA family protein